MHRELGRYLRYHEARNSTAKTITWHSDSIGSFFKFLTARTLPVDLPNLNADNARDWISSQRDRGLAQKTIATRITSLKAFAHWLVEEDYLAKDPLRRVPVPHVDDKAMPIFDPEDIDVLLAACDRRTVTGLRDHALVLLLYSTMIRSAEASNLQHADLDWQKGLILVRRGKGGKPRTVPLSPPVERALDRYLRFPYRKAQTSPYVFLTMMGKPFTPDGFRQIFMRLSRKTMLEVNPHKFRHSGSVQYLRNGGKLETLRALLGHSSLDMTLHYARIAGVDVKAAHETADPTRSLKGGRGERGPP